MDLSLHLLSSKIKKKDKERYENMAKVIMQLYLLTMHIMGALPNTVIIVVYKSIKTYDEEETKSLLGNLVLV